MDSDHDHVYNIALYMRSDNQTTPQSVQSRLPNILETPAFLRDADKALQHQS